MMTISFLIFYDPVFQGRPCVLPLLPRATFPLDICTQVFDPGVFL
jgi:hypothetical protein